MAIGKHAAVAAAATGKDVSYKRLFNPLSQLIGGGDKYPEWLLKLFPANPKAAWWTAKLGGIGALALITAAGTRALLHNNAITETYEYDDPSRKLKSQLGTTFMAPLAPDKKLDPTTGEVKEASLRKYAGWFDKLILKGFGTKHDKRPDAVPLADPNAMLTNTMRVLLPMTALVLGGAGGWKLADMWSDKRRNAELTAAVDEKSRKVRQLIQTRARLAKGLASANDVDKTITDTIDPEESYIKQASMTKKAAGDEAPIARGLFTGYGLLFMSLMMAAGLGSYKYFSASDPNNIKFKALKKGLRAYARDKTSMTPITIVPADASDYFASIDAAGNDQGVRELPEQQPINRGIAISD